MKKIGYLLLIVLCVLGAVGGIGSCIYNGDYHFAVGIAVLAYTAWPKFKEYTVKLTL